MVLLTRNPVQGGDHVRMIAGVFLKPGCPETGSRSCPGNRPVRPPPLADCPTGYAADKPPWLTVWLLIIADNTMHVLINGAALEWL